MVDDEESVLSIEVLDLLVAVVLVRGEVVEVLDFFDFVVLVLIEGLVVLVDFVVLEEAILLDVVL